MNLSNLRMFAEVRCTFVESFDNFGENVNPEAKNLEVITSDNKDEFSVKPKDINSLEDWEIIVFRSRKFIFTMNSCISYEHFVEVLESLLKKISAFLTPADIVSMGVQGYYLYPLSSLQEFSQLIFAWSDDYIRDEASQVEINDLGVDVFFQKDSLRINIVCKLISRTEAGSYFPITELNNIHETNLFINIQVATNEPLKLQKSLTTSLSQSIKTHVLHATKLIEQRLGKMQGEKK